jgi:hypothetical protein
MSLKPELVTLMTGSGTDLGQELDSKDPTSVVN